MFEIIDEGHDPRDYHGRHVPQYTIGIDLAAPDSSDYTVVTLRIGDTIYHINRDKSFNRFQKWMINWCFGVVAH